MAQNSEPMTMNATSPHSSITSPFSDDLDLIHLSSDDPSKPPSNELWSILFQSFQSFSKHFPNQTVEINGQIYPCRFSLPTYLLYNEKGLQLYDEITKLEEYYLFTKEHAILQTYSDQLVENLLPNACVIELGCGSLKKTALLLDAIEKKGLPVHFYALDLNKRELVKSLRQFKSDPSKPYQHIQFHGLIGTYEDGLAFLGQQQNWAQKVVLWLGSSMGNLTRDEAIQFLYQVHQILNQPQDALILGIDKRNDPEKIRKAYNDPKGVTRAFSMNLFKHLESILGSATTPLKESLFEFFPYYNETAGRHECYYKCKKQHAIVLRNDSTSMQVELSENELIHIEFSFKYSTAELNDLLRYTGLQCIQSLEDPEHMFRLLWLQSRLGLTLEPASPILISLKENKKLSPQAQITHNWRNALKIWDWLFDEVLKTEEVLLQRPISLRHPFLFYLGHLSCFCDIQLSKVFGIELEPPKLYPIIFERGIDPIVDDPTKCHPHSEVPDTWPSLSDLHAYREKIRKKIDLLVEKETWNAAQLSSLSMAFEHDIMHLETIFYMLWQLDPSLLHKNFLAKAVREVDPELAPAHWVSFPSCDIIQGTNQDFAWDLEKPERATHVTAFEIQSRPVSNGEWYQFLVSMNPNTLSSFLPASWQWKSKEDVWVRQFSEYVPLNQVRSHPVLVPLEYARVYAEHHQARIPTETELLVLYQHPSSKSDTLATKNFGFVRLGTCPMGKYENRPGNAWEWTSTILSEHAGFQIDPRYPGYSKDFFDGLHYVCLGASWATHPTIANRKSFRNWYQKNYPFAFTTFRLCR